MADDLSWIDHPANLRANAALLRAIAEQSLLHADEIERLQAYQDETAKAWTKLTESQEQEIEQLHKEAVVDIDRYEMVHRRLDAAAARKYGGPEPDLDKVLGYAQRLATSLWERHWKTDAPDWKPLPDLLGVLTQIDNATACLVRTNEAADEIERLKARVAELQAQCGYTESINMLEIVRLKAIADTTDIMTAQAIKRLNDEIERLTAALEDERAAHQVCVEMRDAAVAALRDRPRDDGTVIAVGGEPGASAGKSK